MIPPTARLLGYLDPQWGRRARRGWSRSWSRLVRLTHRECHNGVCKLASFTYGTGQPTLWRHENLNERRTMAHRRVRRRAADLLQADPALRPGRAPGLGRRIPSCRRLHAQPPDTDARFAFFAGALNACFEPRASSARTRGSTATTPGATRCTIVPNYGHLDVFMGEHAAHDVFPDIARRARGPDVMRPRNASSGWRGRHALVDGIPFTLPVDCRETPALMAAFPISARAAAELMPGNEVHPLRARRRRRPADDHGRRLPHDRHRPYIEFSIAIACTHGERPAPPLLPALLRSATGPASSSSTCRSRPRSRSKAAKASGGCPSTRPTSTS